MIIAVLQCTTDIFPHLILFGDRRQAVLLEIDRNNVYIIFLIKYNINLHYLIGTTYHPLNWYGLVATWHLLSTYYIYRLVNSV